jgi:hypothetical protein
VNLATGKAAGTVGCKLIISHTFEYRFGEDAARRIAGTEKQYIAACKNHIVTRYGKSYN